MSDVFAKTYGVELLCAKEPRVDKRELLHALRQYCPPVKPLDGKDDSSLLSFIHEDHQVQFSDSALPAQTFMAVADRPIDRTAYEPSVQQSWNFPKVREALDVCQTTFLVTDLMSAGLPYQDRLRLFLKVLTGTLQVVECEAVYWPHSQQLVDPRSLQHALASSFSDAFFLGPLNVRLYNVDGRDGEMVMDTLGLGALGLNDLQCHFRALPPTEVARVLYNTGLYVFERGDAIRAGHTVPGVNGAGKWLCQREEALISPSRIVIDLNPGRPYAAGTRAGG